MKEAFSINYPSVNMGEIIYAINASTEKDIEIAEEVVTEIEEEVKEEIKEEVKEELEDELKEDIVVAKVDNKVIAPSRGDVSNRSSSETAPAGSLNKYVLDVIKTYKIGSYPYLLNNDYKNYNGVTENLYYKGELLLKAEPSGSKASNCTGITFEVFFKAMQNRNNALGIDPDNFNGMTKDELHDMALTWFVAMGSKSQSNIAVAVEKYDLGYRITNLEELRAGDFIDLSRENNSGHTVVFLNWIREGNKIIGFKYWSSQGSTKGISYKEEYFNIVNSNGKKYGNVIIDSLHMARIIPK